VQIATPDENNGAAIYRTYPRAEGKRDRVHIEAKVQRVVQVLLAIQAQTNSQQPMLAEG
jgi:hypothetical protein